MIRANTPTPPEQHLQMIVIAGQTACEDMSEVFLTEVSNVIAITEYLSMALTEAVRGGMPDNAVAALLDDFEHYCTLIRACRTTAIAAVKANLERSV